MRFILISLILLLTNTAIYCQQATFHRIGARASGMGFSVANNQDEAAGFNNPAALSGLSGSRLFFNFDNRFSISELNTLAASFNGEIWNGNFALGAGRFGGDLFNIQRLTGSFSNQFGLASLGIRSNYDQFIIQDFGRKGILNFDFGGFAQINPQLSFAAFALNITQAGFRGFSDETLPMVLVAGIAYKPDKHVFLSAELEKDLDFDVNPRFGIEYILRDIMALRTGYQFLTASPHFGIGLRVQNWQFDFAAHHHLQLGFVNQVSIAFQLAEK
jgi:hypothetical protein